MTASRTGSRVVGQPGLRAIASAASSVAAARSASSPATSSTDAAPDRSRAAIDSSRRRYADPQRVLGVHAVPRVRHGAEQLGAQRRGTGPGRGRRVAGQRAASARGAGPGGRPAPRSRRAPPTSRSHVPSGGDQRRAERGQLRRRQRLREPGQRRPQREVGVGRGADSGGQVVDRDHRAATASRRRRAASTSTNPSRASRPPSVVTRPAAVPGAVGPSSRPDVTPAADLERSVRPPPTRRSRSREGAGQRTDR